MADQHSNSTINQSVYCAFEIVNYLAGRGWCRVKDISAALGIDSAKVHRILKPRILLNYIEYNAKTHRYRLGMAFFSISYHMTRGESILSIVRQPMEWLANKTLENVNFYMLSSIDHTKIVNIYKIENNLLLSGIDEGVGESDAIYNTAGGKCLLAYLPLNEQREIAQALHYVQRTKYTITSASDLMQELSHIRECGYALDRREFSENMVCIAMPLFDPNGDIYAAISVSSSKTMDPAMLSYYRGALEETIKKVNNFGLFNTI